MQEGREERREEGMRTMLLDTAEIRFGTVDANVRESVDTIDSLSQLRELHRLALSVESSEKFEKELRRMIEQNSQSNE